MSDERVLVVPRAVVPDEARWHGLRTEGLDGFLRSLPEHGRFEERSAMEVDPAYKQVIPYLLLRDGDRIFLMRRTTAGGDARLHDRWSIGVGGHLDPGDVDVIGGLRREWREELDADWEPAFEPLALLNDDTTEVGAVHLGVVFLADAAGRPAGVRETDKLEGRFVDAHEVDAVADRLETWSALVWTALRDGRLQPATGRLRP
jgi:predicted NUDIX family phosphoesterase